MVLWLSDPCPSQQGAASIRQGQLRLPHPGRLHASLHPGAPNTFTAQVPACPALRPQTGRFPDTQPHHLHTKQTSACRGNRVWAGLRAGEGEVVSRRRNNR